MHNWNTILLASLLFFCTNALVAQIEVGLNAGVSLYEGDISPAGIVRKLENTKRSIGVYGRIPVGDRLAFRGFVQSSKIQGGDQFRTTTTTRNLSFRTNIFEIGAVAEIYPWGNYQRLAPFFQVGASVYNFNPETEFNGRWVELQPLGTEGQGMPGFAPKYNLTRFSVPIGVGVRYSLTENFSLGVQAAARLLFFDHLDDVSGNYVNYYTLLDGRGVEGATGNGSLAAALGNRQGEYFGTEPVDIPTSTGRGDATNNDWYYTATITLGYRIGSGLINGGSKKGGSSRYNKCYSF